MREPERLNAFHFPLGSVEGNHVQVGRSLFRRKSVERVIGEVGWQVEDVLSSETKSAEEKSKAEHDASHLFTFLARSRVVWDASVNSALLYMGEQIINSSPSPLVGSSIYIGAAVAREVVGLRRAYKYERAASWYRQSADKRDSDIATMKEQFPLD